MALAPEQATIRRNGEWVSMQESQVQPGDVMLVKPADRRALDGDVVSGESGVNQVPITGESIPVDKPPGDEVYAGSISHKGVLEVRVTRPATDTALARIIHMAGDAQHRKSPAQSFIELFSAVYTPVVFVVALLIMVLPPLLTIGSWADGFYRRLELRVVACPCALVISTPVAVVPATGSAARHGILVKGGITLKKPGSIRAMAFDKTGTFTEGKPRVTGRQGMKAVRGHIFLCTECCMRCMCNREQSFYPLKRSSQRNMSLHFSSGTGESIFYTVRRRWFVLPARAGRRGAQAFTAAAVVRGGKGLLQRLSHTFSSRQRCC